MLTIAPLDQFEIAGRTFRVALMPPDRLQFCEVIGQSLRLGRFPGDLVPFAVATILKAMVVDNHPDVCSTELVPHLTYFHFQQIANELARQLLLSLPMETMGKA